MSRSPSRRRRRRAVARASAESCFRPDWVSPPGDTIEDLCRLRRLSMNSLAEALCLDIASTKELIAGRHVIDHEMAEKLSERLGSSPVFWMRREAQYRAGLRRLGRA